VRTPRRIGRLVAGLSVAAAATAATLLTAAPADAGTVVQVQMLGFEELRITGTNGNDGITVSGAGPFFVRNSLGPLQPGPGCVRDNSDRAAVRCNKARSITINGMLGRDSLGNGTSLPSFLFGGGGSDQISGGFGNDFIEGNAGSDVVDGSAGFDTCSAEAEFGCEK
jgi:Ca2+-binding RTX toxin-like protein